MQRREKEMRAVPSTDIRPVNGEISIPYLSMELNFVYHTPDVVRSDATIGGIAIKLPGPLNTEEKQTIIDVANAIAAHATNPFVDNPRIPQLSDGENIL